MAFDLPLFGSSAPPAVRRPLFQVSFGGGAAAGGGGLLSAAASAVGLGGGGAADPWQRSIARITLERGVAPELDGAEITLADDAQAPPVAVGDAGSIALGFEDEGPTTVFTGRIEAIRRDARGSQRITIANGAARLAALRVQQSFENQSAGNVVRELAGKANVTPGNIADGADLAFLVLDDARSAWDHIARLARVSGHMAIMTADDELDFRPPDDGQPVQSFRWGVNVLSLERAQTEPVFQSVTVSGEGAAGSQGKDAWNWLTKQPSSVTGQAGSGDRTRSFADRALRTADAVQAAARALADAAARAAQAGVLLVPGAPAVLPASQIQIGSTPRGGMDGTYLVTRVRHTCDKRAGFRTRVQFIGASGAAGATGGLP